MRSGECDSGECDRDTDIYLAAIDPLSFAGSRLA